jgi:acyl dehydratase
VRVTSETSLFGASEVHVGQDLGGRTTTITAADVARYRAGTDTPEATDDPAPALLHHSEVYRDLSWYLPNLIGNLHARQEWQVFAPWRVGDSVRSHSTVVERYRKRNRNYVVNEVLWTTADGRWLQRSRTHQSFLADDPVDDGYVVDRDREKRADRAFAPPPAAAPDGRPLAPRTRTITHAMCEAFSGPRKSYHTDREMALALGFPDIVVQGMLSVCFAAELVAAHFGDGWHRGGTLDVRLVNVVWPGDALTTSGTVREVVVEGSRRRSLLEVRCTKADGTVTLVGAASALG